MNHKKLIHRINLYEGMYRNGRTLGRAIEGTEEVLKEASAALTELEAKYELLARYAAKKYTQCEALEKENAQLRAELEQVKRERDAYEVCSKDLLSKGNCNECGGKENCTYRPRPGETVRANCPLWRGSQKEE